MAISEDWCIEAVCDRCRCVMYFPYVAKTGSVALLTRKGWRVEDGRALCPMCNARRGHIQQGEPTRKRRKRKKKAVKWD